jgi:hypothetical protein
MENLTIYGISTDGPAFCEAQGLSKVFQAYADNCSREDIMYSGVGFNSSSGYVYIALENGVTICSMLGRDVEFMITNFENGEEYFFDTYDEALNFDPQTIDNEN